MIKTELMCVVKRHDKERGSRAVSLVKECELPFCPNQGTELRLGVTDADGIFKVQWATYALGAGVLTLVEYVAATSYENFYDEIDLRKAQGFVIEEERP